MKRQAVLDTNVLISGILWRGIPYQLLTRAEQGKLSIYSSLDILTEVYRVLHYPKFQWRRGYRFRGQTSFGYQAVSLNSHFNRSGLLWRFSADIKTKERRAED
jgi:hypothetical protein